MMTGPFGDIRQVPAGDLDVGYADVGPQDGPVAVLLHGWPYDIHTFAECVPMLTEAGYRVIVPYVRGFGSTRFLSAGTPRTGQQSALAVDTVALMDALGIERAVSPERMGSGPRPSSPPCGRSAAAGSSR